MTEINQNFTLYTGETLDVDVAITDENGAALNLTGAAITWAMAFSYDVGRNHNQVVKTLAAGGISLVGLAAAGTVRIHLLPADTVNLVGAEYVHEMTVTIAGVISKVLRGTVTLIKSVT